MPDLSWLAGVLTNNGQEEGDEEKSEADPS
jgi:hypothetical protein